MNTIYFDYLTIFGKFLFVFLAAFIFWRKLKEDYPNEQILSLTLVIILLGYLGLRLDSLAGAFLAAVAATLLTAGIQKIKWWPLADALVYPFLFVGLGISLINLLDLLPAFSWFSLLLPILFLLVLFLSLKMEKSYRSLSWYKSGKIGFLFYFTIIAFFGPFLVLEITTGKPLYWQMLVEAIIVLGAGVLLYWRGNEDQREKRDPLLKFLQIFKKK